jgi:hypothetical protein
MPGLLNAIGAGLGQGVDQIGQWNQQQAQIALAHQALLQRQQLMQEYQKQQQAMGAVGAALGGPAGLFPQPQFPQMQPGGGPPQGPMPQTPIGTGMSAPPQPPPQPQGIAMPRFAPAPPVAPPGGASAAIPPKGGGIPPAGVPGALQTQADLVAESQSPPPQDQPILAAMDQPQGGGMPQSAQFMQQIAQTFQQSDPQTFYKAIKTARPDIDDETAAMATEKLMQMGSRGTPQERMMAMLLGRELSGLQSSERQQAGFGEREKLQANTIAAANQRHAETEARLNARMTGAGGGFDSATRAQIQTLRQRAGGLTRQMAVLGARNPPPQDQIDALAQQRAAIDDQIDKMMTAKSGAPASAAPPAAPAAPPPSGILGGVGNVIRSFTQ